MTDEKKRYPREVGLLVARELCHALKPVCDRLVVAGSLRRGKATIGDVELLFVGMTETRPKPMDMFDTVTVDLAEEVIRDLERQGIIARRPNKLGGTAWGPLNKLAVHCGSGLPVDLFSANAKNWWNYLVCRTGPADSNTAIAIAAQARGWQWNPYREGFTNLKDGRIVAMESELQVFEFVGLPFHPPQDRK